MPIRVVLADDHPIVLHGLQTLFERQGDIEVAAACTDGRSALEAARRLQPDVLVVDLRMSDLSGLDVLKMAAAERLSCRCVLLTAAISDHEIVEAMRHGTSGLVLKESAPDHLVDCIRGVVSGKQWIDQEMVVRAFRNVLDQPGAPAVEETLTPRELEIVRMVAAGLRNKGVAARLGISEGTVKVHLHNIYEKLGVEGRVELLVSAQRRGLL
jgi:DNA-binding NarL/FixJ family response regulator